MKKLSILFTVLALVLSSCSSDDDGGGGGDTSGDILGTWVGQEVDYTGTTTTDFQGQTIEADFVGEAFDVNYTLQFSENPNVVEADGSYSINLTTSISGQVVDETTVEDIEFLNDGEWSRSGNELTIMDNGEATVATILELTDTTLKLGVNEVQDVSQQGATITTEVDVIMTYTRQ